MPKQIKKQITPHRKNKSSVGYQYDEGAGEWSWTCSACKKTIHAPSRAELVKANFYHARIKPIEKRTCPQKW